MWRKYFKVVKVVPGRIVTPRHGLIDLSADNLSVDLLKELYEEDWPYIEITHEGMKTLYGDAAVVYPELVPSVHESVPEPVDSASDVKAPLKKKKHPKKKAE